MVRGQYVDIRTTWSSKFSLGSIKATQEIPHQMGIPGIQKLFGINPMEVNYSSKTDFQAELERLKSLPLGVDNRRMTVVPTTAFEQGSMKFDDLIIKYTGLSTAPIDSQWAKLIAKNYNGVTGYWDSRNFMLLATNTATYTYILDIHKSINEMDFCIWNETEHNETWFNEPGLAFCSAEYLSTYKKNDLIAKDERFLNMFSYTVETGIYNDLQKAELHWEKLQPIDVDGEILFLLLVKTTDYNKYKSGIYSLEELRQWIDGKGPIVVS